LRCFDPERIVVAPKKSIDCAMTTPTSSDGASGPSGDTVVHLVDDDRKRRDHYAEILARAGFRTQQHEWADDLMSVLAGQTDTSVVVANVEDPLMDGLGLIRDLYQTGRPLPVILVDGDSAVPTVVRVMKAGAVDYLVRPVAADTLVGAVGQAVELAEAVAEGGALPADAAQRVASLTPREREIMDELVRGRTNKDIARAYDISPRTVEIHRGRVMLKMRARNLAELVRMVVSFGQTLSAAPDVDPGPPPHGGTPGGAIQPNWRENDD